MIDLKQEEGHTMVRVFPDHFLWGASTAGHQVDGGDTTSDISFLEHVQPTVFKQPAGSACKSWERWQDDLDLVSGMGLNAYRFSVEWARIEPEEKVVDQSALDHYDRMVDGCLDRGITPLITLSHFVCPHWFGAKAGWFNPDAPSLFADECLRVLKVLGDRVAMAVTFNEPNLPRILSTGALSIQTVEAQRQCLEAASRKAGVERYRVGNVVIPEEVEQLELGFRRAHACAVEAIRSQCPNLPVGLSLAVIDESYVSEKGKALAQARRDACYRPCIQAVQGNDFIGVQNYERETMGDQGPLAAPEGVDTSESGAPVCADSLVNAVVYIRELTGLPVLVTEHGVCTADDQVRSRFISSSLPPLVDLARDGFPLLGYFHWSLLDNFEWISGYDMHYGLCSVDRSGGTYDRTPKGSAQTYRKLVAETVI